jgi:hypothetical protein
MAQVLEGCAIDLSAYERDLAEANKLGIDLHQYQSMRHFNKVADKVLGPAEEDPELRKAREVVAKKEAEVSRLEQERISAAQEWERLAEAEADIQKRTAHGEYVISETVKYRADIEHTIHTIFNKKHDQPWYNENPNGVMEVGKMLAGVKEVLALAPAWRESLAAEKAENDKARAEFARKHGIEHE